MKKLKKSLLVVPALGVLMLAAAGSVGGTVAWFSSVNTFETNISSFAVGRAEGNLDVTMTAIPAMGTIQVGAGVAVGKSDVGDVKLTHGSFNHSVAALGSTSVYTISSQVIGQGAHTFLNSGLNINRTKFLYQSHQIAGTYTFEYVLDGNKWNLLESGKVAAVSNIAAANLASDWGLSYTGTPGNGQRLIITLENSYKLADTESPVDPENDPSYYWTYNHGAAINDVYWYHAVSWDMEFSYAFGSDTTTRNVYFDLDSSIERTSHVEVGTEETWKGFRIAFHDGTARNVIWAPQQTRANAHYVSATNTLSDYATDSAALSVLDSSIASTSQILKVNTSSSGGQATADTYKNYLCELRNNSSSKTIHCVAWFEGSDPNVINEADLDTVAANLRFFAVAAA